jgi:MFS family permease
MASPVVRARLGALACPPFARLMSGQVVTAIGTQMSNMAAAWVLYRLTHSALALGLQGLCFSLPIAILPLATGILADRFSRTALVKATLAAEAAQALGLAAIAGAGALRPWMLYLAAVADACRLAVNIPAASALVPNIVPPGQLLSALALIGSTWSSSAMIGPALAGVLLVHGPALVFALNGICTLAALGAVASLGQVRPPVSAADPPRFGAGLAYLRAHRAIGWLEGIVVVAMTAVLGVETVLPVFATGVWHTGAAGYGLLRVAPGIGAVLAGAGLSAFPVRGRPPILIVAFAGAGAAIAGFAAGPSIALAFILLAAGSSGLAAAQVIAGTWIQQAIPDALRGRISAIGSCGQNGIAGIAAAATSGLAAGTGPGLAVVILALLTTGAGVTFAALLARARPTSAGPAPAQSGTAQAGATRADRTGTST